LGEKENRDDRKAGTKREFVKSRAVDHPEENKECKTTERARGGKCLRIKTNQ